MRLRHLLALATVLHVAVSSAAHELFASKSGEKERSTVIEGDVAVALAAACAQRARGYTTTLKLAPGRYVAHVLRSLSMSSVQCEHVKEP